MRPRRPRVLPVLATILVVSGFALMLASLRIETTRGSGAVGAAAVVPTLATPILSTGTPGASDSTATRLVARAQAAQRSLSYKGVKVVSRWNGDTSTSVVVTVDHQPGRGTVVVAGDAQGSATGPATSVSDSSAAQEPLDPLDVLVRNYRLVSGGSAVVADRPTDKVEAERTDGTVAACFWVDRSTGLVLRRELYDPTGRTIEAVSFTRVSIDAASTAGPTATATPSATSGTPSSSPAAAVDWVAMKTDDAAALRAAGWPIPANLTGGMTLYSIHEQAGADSPVVQLGYTDGLVSISVFLQRGVLDSDALAGYAPIDVDGGRVWSRASGAAPFYVWQSQAPAAPSAATTGAEDSASRDIVVSATTDSPSAPMSSVVAALPAEPPQEDGVGDRVSRGVHRVTSWFDPQD